MPAADPRFVIHVYELAAARGDDPFETVAVVGPFDTVEATELALTASGWAAYDGELMTWRAPSKRWLHAEILKAGDHLPSG